MLLIQRSLLATSGGFQYSIYTSRWRKGEAAIVTASAFDTYQITWHFVPINLQITYGSGTFTFTQIQAGNVGGAENYSVVPSLFNDAGNFTITNVAGVNWALLGQGAYQLKFKDFFEVCDKLWNLGMQIEPDGLGGWRVRIEPIDYFYSAPTSVTLRNIADVEHTSENALFAKRWHFGKMTDQENTTFYDFNPEKNTFPGNVDQLTSCFSEWYVDSVWNCDPTYDRRYEQKEFVLGLGLTYQDDILDGIIQNEKYSYIICVNHFPAALPDTARFYQYEHFWYVNALNLGTGQEFFYDVKTQPEYVYINHRNIMPKHDNWVNTWTTLVTNTTVAPVTSATPSLAIIPEGAYWLPYRWKFKRYITDEDWANIVNSQVIVVNEGDDPVNDVNGYIREITYRISDGDCEFILETKS